MIENNQLQEDYFISCSKLYVIAEAEMTNAGKLIIEEINNIWLEKLSRDKKRLQIEKSLFSNEDFCKRLTSAILSVTLNNITSVHDYYRTVRKGKKKKCLKSVQGWVKQCWEDNFISR